jgi:single-strand DNA-binding protein
MVQPALRLPEQNSVVIVGRLTRDPEVRFTAKGQSVCRFDLAVNRRYKDATGNWTEEVSFIPVVVWGDAAARCGERLKKGLPAHVDGRLQSRTWETKEGQKRTSLEVIARRVQFLSKATGESSEEEPAETAPAASTGSQSDDDIPF